jgi:rubrerythrin
MEEGNGMIRFVCEDCNYNMLMRESDSGTRFYCPTCNSILDEQSFDVDDQ